MLQFLYGIQNAIHDTFALRIEAFAASHDWTQLFVILPFGVVFGVAHAMTPGHSKAVLATYLIGSGLSRTRGLITALTLSVTHISSAVILALAASTLVSRTITNAGQAPVLELISRSLLVAIGLWLILRAILNRPHVHGEGEAFGFIAGLVPCPLTLFIMFYSISKGVPEAGLTFAVAMLAGVGLVLTAVALLAILARDLLARHMRAVGQIGRGLEGLAGVLLLAIAVQELF